MPNYSLSLFLFACFYLHLLSSTGDGMTAYVAYKVSTRVCKIKNPFETSSINFNKGHKPVVVNEDVVSAIHRLVFSVIIGHV